MSSLRLQVSAIVFAMLTIHGLAQWWLGWLAGSAPTALGVPLVVAVAMALLAQVLLRPLREDFAALRRHAAGAAGTAGAPGAAATSGAGDSQRPLPEPQVAEMADLFEAVGLLRARSAELEDLEQEAHRAVEDAERMRVSFVASMGHDLRGPLNAIVGFADLLAIEAEAGGGEQRQSITIIRRAAQDLLFLLDQILDWARFESGRIAIEPETVHLEALLPEVVASAEARSADRGMRVALAIDASDGLPPLELDPRRIRQAVACLMDHATRDAGGPRVSLRARVAAPDDRHDRGVRITVHDPGLSIRQADHDTFFEAFRPSYAPGGKRIAGLGVAPALARVLVRAHGGDVWFESRPDTGTTFTIWLPLAHTPTRDKFGVDGSASDFPFQAPRRESRRRRRSAYPG